MRDMQSRTQQEHAEKLAASNAAIVRHAARALIRDCDTLQLMGIGPASGISVDGAADSSHGHSAVGSGSHGRAAGGHRISGLICFDEMQVGAAGEAWGWSHACAAGHEAHVLVQLMVQSFSCTMHQVTT